jgi:predicted phage tail protein
MTTVSLEGRLGQVVGDTFSFKTRTLKEVFAAIEANTGKLRSYLSGNGKRYFAIFVNGKEIDPDASLNTNVQSKKVLIIPVLMGAFIASTTAAIVGAMALKSVIAIKVATFVVGTVLSAALAFGISLLIAKLMTPDDPDLANTTSFAFGQAENVSRQGVVVPVGYGRLQVGSRTISVNLFNVDRSIYNKSESGGLYDIARLVHNPRNTDIQPTNDGVIQGDYSGTDVDISIGNGDPSDL